MRKLVAACFVMALVLAPLALVPQAAFAQMPMPGISLGNKDKPALTDEERAKQKAIDDAYAAASKKIPEKQAPHDPWASVRPNPSATANGQQ